jgi:hypothetical protein
MHEWHWQVHTWTAFISPQVYDYLVMDNDVQSKPCILAQWPHPGKQLGDW